MLFPHFLRFSGLPRAPFRFMSHSVMQKVATSEPVKKTKKPVDRAAVKDAVFYCEDLVKRRDYENYLGWLLMKEKVKMRVLASLALNVEISIIRQKIKRNSGVTGINQLQFWKEALNVLFVDGKGPVPRQPVITALQAFGDPKDLYLFQQLVAARQETLGDRAFESVVKLEQNGRNVHGTLIKLIGSAFEDDTHQNEAFKNAADSMGAALGIVTLVRATVPLLREGVVLLPADLMTIHGLTGDKVYNNKDPEAFKSLIKDLVQLAETHISSSRKLVSGIPRESRLALVPSGLKVDHVVRLLKKNKYNIFEERLHKPHPLISWQMWWRCSRKVF